MVAAAVALVVAGGAVYVALAGHGHPDRQAAGFGTPGSISTTNAGQSAGSTAPAATTTPTTSPASTSTAPTSSTTTTPPKPVLLLSATGGTDTYQLTSKTASIVVTAKGPCWVEVRAGSPKGQVVTEQTLQTGEKVQVTGPAWIRLGDPPYAKVSVDGSPTTVPGSQYGIPLNLDFTVS
jgi:RodZ C-terminal domain